MAKNKKIDWDVIEEEYKLLVLTKIKSVRALARDHDVSHVIILKHAKKHNWGKTMDQRVTALTKELLVSDSYQELPDVEARKKAEDAAVLKTAKNCAAVVICHREQLAAARKSCVDAQTHLDALVSTIDMANLNIDSKKNDLKEQILQADHTIKKLESAAGLLEKLTRNLGRVIPLERLAHSVDADDDDDDKATFNINFTEHGEGEAQ